MQEGLNHFEANNLGGMLPDGEGGKGKRGGGNLLHDPSHKKDFDQVRDWWIQARTRLSSARYEMALDDDFYDGLQWREQDLLVLEERGQPALVFNQIKPVIDWIIGTEKRTRFDWNVLPREDSDRTAAEAKTKLLKYTDDVNHAQMARSRAFADAVRVGLGWLEAGIRNDPTDEPLYSRSESWRNMWWDDLSEELDYSDARYVFRSRWVDLDIAQAMFPDNKGELAAAARTHDLFGGTDEDGDGFQLYYQTDAQGRPVEVRSYTEDASYAVTNRRSRVRLVECWYRKPVPRKVVHMFDRKHRDYARMHGMPLRSNEDQAAAKPLVEEGLAGVYDAIKLEVWCMMFCDGHLLQNSPSPYRHDRFPFIPVWAFRRKRDGAPYGVIRNQRDPQEDLNKRRSKALHILNSKLVVAEEDAVEDIDEAREEVDSPDGWVTVRRNKLFEIHQDTAVAREHLMMEERDVGYVREMGGVTTENLGHETNASSGKAIKARQDEGHVVTTELYDNKFFALQLQGEVHLSLAEQYYTAEKVIRLLNPKGKPEFHVINQVFDDQVDPQTEKPLVENDITATKADFVVDLADYRESYRQAQFDVLMEMLLQMMQMGAGNVAMAMLDLVIDMWDGPNKDVIVARIRKETGQTDPAQEGTPEAEAAEQAKQQAEDEAAQLAKRMQEAEVDLAEQKARDARAAAALKRQQAASQAIQMLAGAAEVGQTLLVTPQVAAMIDELQTWVDESVDPDKGQPPPDQVPQQQPPQGAMMPPAEAAPLA